MKKLLILVVALLVGLVSQASAQTTVTSTTLSAAVATRDTPVVELSSTSGIERNDLLVIVSGMSVAEAMQVDEVVSSGQVRVRRGVAGTTARTHPTGALVYTGHRREFYVNDVAGACVRSQESFLPHINTVSGRIFDCSPGGVWYDRASEQTISCRALLVTDQVDQSCWTADANYVVVAITEVHATAEASGTLTLIPRRQQGTQAPSAGDALATAINMVGGAAPAQTVKTATLTTTGANLLLDAGDRLGLDYTDDTAGELAGVVVTFTVARW